VCTEQSFLKAISEFPPRTGYGVSVCDRRYSSTLPLSSALDVGGWPTLPVGRLNLGVAVWLVSKVALVGSGNFRPTAIRTPSPADCSVLSNRPSNGGPIKFLLESLIEAVLKLFQIKVVPSSNESLNFVLHNYGTEQRYRTGNCIMLLRASCIVVMFGRRKAKSVQLEFELERWEV
jgi:hypothetical protein